MLVNLINHRSLYRYTIHVYHSEYRFTLHILQHNKLCKKHNKTYNTSSHTIYILDIILLIHILSFNTSDYNMHIILYSIQHPLCIISWYHMTSYVFHSYIRHMFLVSNWKRKSTRHDIWYVALHINIIIRGISHIINQRTDYL